MDVRRPRLGDWTAGVSGIALLGSLFLPWYSVSGDGCPAPPAPCGQSEVTAWEAFDALDLFLVVTAVFALGLLIVSLTQRAPAIPIAAAVLTSLIGMAATVAVLVRLLAPPPAADGSGRELVWLGLAAAAGVAAGGWLSMRDEASGVRADRRPGRRGRSPAGEVPALPVPPTRGKPEAGSG